MRVRPSVNPCASVCNTLPCNPAQVLHLGTRTESSSSYSYATNHLRQKILPWCCCMAIFVNMHARVLQLIWSDHFPRMPWSPRSRMHSLVKWQELRHNLGKALPLWCCLSTCLTLLACRPSLYSLNPSQLCNYESPADHLLFKLLTFNLNRWLPIILLDFL